MRIGHRIGAQSKQDRKVVPPFLGAEIGLDDRGCVLAIVGKLGDPQEGLHRRLVELIDAQDLPVDRNRAQLIIELSFHDVGELVGQLDTLRLVKGSVGSTLQHVHELRPLPLAFVEAAEALECSPVLAVRIEHRP